MAGTAREAGGVQLRHSLYVQDPDGNGIEPYVDVPGVDPKNDPSLLMTPVTPLNL